MNMRFAFCCVFCHKDYFSFASYDRHLKLCRSCRTHELYSLPAWRRNTQFLCLFAVSCATAMHFGRSVSPESEINLVSETISSSSSFSFTHCAEETSGPSSSLLHQGSRKLRSRKVGNDLSFRTCMKEFLDTSERRARLPW